MSDAEDVLGILNNIQVTLDVGSTVGVKKMVSKASQTSHIPDLDLWDFSLKHEQQLDNASESALAAMLNHLPSVGKSHVLLVDVKQVLFPWCLDPNCHIFWTSAHDVFSKYDVLLLKISSKERYAFAKMFHKARMIDVCVDSIWLNSVIKQLYAAVIKNHRSLYCGRHCKSQKLKGRIQVVNVENHKIAAICCGQDAKETYVPATLLANLFPETRPCLESAARKYCQNGSQKRFRKHDINVTTINAIDARLLTTLHVSLQCSQYPGSAWHYFTSRSIMANWPDFISLLCRPHAHLAAIRTATRVQGSRICASKRKHITPPKRRVKKKCTKKNKARQEAGRLSRQSSDSSIGYRDDPTESETETTGKNTSTELDEELETIEISFVDNNLDVTYDTAEDSNDVAGCQATQTPPEKSLLASESYTESACVETIANVSKESNLSALTCEPDGKEVTVRNELEAQKCFESSIVISDVETEILYRNESIAQKEEIIKKDADSAGKNVTLRNENGQDGAIHDCNLTKNTICGNYTQTNTSANEQALPIQGQRVDACYNRNSQWYRPRIKPEVKTYIMKQREKQSKGQENACIFEVYNRRNQTVGPQRQPLVDTKQDTNNQTLTEERSPGDHLYKHFKVPYDRCVLSKKKLCRLDVSENVLIKSILSSGLFYSSRIRKRWRSLLYSRIGLWPKQLGCSPNHEEKQEAFLPRLRGYQENTFSPDQLPPSAPSPPIISDQQLYTSIPQNWDKRFRIVASTTHLYDNAGYIVLTSGAWLPYITRNGFKFIFVKHAGVLFPLCQPKCSIPRSTLRSYKHVVPSMATFDDISSVARTFPHGKNLPLSGDWMVRFDRLCSHYEVISGIISNRHLDTTSKNSRHCNYFCEETTL